jgi:type I restriction enzyme S subunit
MKIAPEIESKYERTRIQSGDVLITIVGSVGQVAIVPDELNGWNIARAVAMIRPKEPELSRWIAFVLHSPQAQHQLGVAANTTVQTTINLKDLRQLQIPFPNSSIRMAVCEILGALDDRIDNLRQTNATLEAIAAALFKSWFVDFDGIAPEDMQESELGLIPKGWRVGTLGDFANVKNGYAFKSGDWTEDGVPVVKIGSVKPAFVDLNQVSFVSELLAEQKEAFRLKVGDMLVGLTGYVGETGLVPPTDNPPMLNQRVGKFEPKNGLDAFVFACVRMPDFKKFCESKAHGSAQANVSTADLLQFSLIDPGVKVINKFCEIACSLFNEMLENQGQIQTLATLRDILLPRLISGQLLMKKTDIPYSTDTSIIQG